MTQDPNPAAEGEPQVLRSIRAVAATKASASNYVMVDCAWATTLLAYIDSLKSSPALKADTVAAWINADAARAKWVAELSAVRKASEPKEQPTRALLYSTITRAIDSKAREIGTAYAVNSDPIKAAAEAVLARFGEPEERRAEEPKFLRRLRKWLSMGEDERASDIIGLDLSDASDSLRYIDRAPSPPAKEPGERVWSCADCGNVMLSSSQVDALSDLVEPYRQENKRLRSELASSLKTIEDETHYALYEPGGCYVVETDPAPLTAAQIASRVKLLQEERRDFRDKLFALERMHADCLKPGDIPTTGLAGTVVALRKELDRESRQHKEALERHLECEKDLAEAKRPSPLIVSTMAVADALGWDKEAWTDVQVLAGVRAARAEANMLRGRVEGKAEKPPSPSGNSGEVKAGETATGGRCERCGHSDGYHALSCPVPGERLRRLTQAAGQKPADEQQSGQAGGRVTREELGLLRAKARGADLGEPNDGVTIRVSSLFALLAAAERDLNQHEAATSTRGTK